MDIRRNKPLWGFGPIGWIALAILTTLVVALLRGWDLVHASAAFLWRFSRDDIGNWATLYVALWAFPAAAMSGVTFGVWGLLYASTALFIYPRKLPRLPIVLLFAVVAIEAYTLGLLPRPLQASLGATLLVVLPSAAAVAVAALLLWLTGRWWCCAPLLIPLLWNAAIEPTLGTRAYPAWVERWHVVLCTHIVIAAPLFLWAIAARLKPAPPGKPCPSCDYDLTGLKDSTPCPECGRAQTPAAS